MSLLLLVLIPMLGSLLVATVPQGSRNYEVWIATLIGVLGLINCLSFFDAVSANQVFYQTITWLPQYDVNIQFRLDGLAWLFTALIQSIFLLVVLYARYYMSASDPVPRFYAFLLAFMGAMQGIVISGNMIQLVIFWELTSIASFLLIGYWHHRADARRGARMAFSITALGGLCLLAGVILLGHIVGSYQLDQVLQSAELIKQHPLYTVTLVLIAIGALSKSAQFPFHFWLPHAMAAPTPVSAFLHSATMVKAGIFLLMRLWPVLSGTSEWTWIIGGAGCLTMLIASYVAIFQHDLKGLLAYSTISHLGLITVLLAMGTPLAMVAALFHTINHATFKASLFMAAGIIDHETGTRDMRQLRGLYKVMPFTSTLAIVAAAAMAGVPLLNGFISKEMFFAETILAGGTDSLWMPAAALIMGISAVAYSLRFIYIFFGPTATDLPQTPKEPPHWMRLPIEILVLCCLIVGIFPAFSVGTILHAAVFSILGEATPTYSLSVWHGLNLPLLMSGVALFGGLAFYLILRRYFNLLQRDQISLLHRFNGKQAYESSMLWLAGGAGHIERRLSTRRLQPQIFAMILAGIAASILVLPSLSLAWQHVSEHYHVDWGFALLWSMGCSCAIATAWQAKYHRLAALLLLGGTGIAVSLTFLWLSAPDLALTQFMVETISVILILLGLRWLPPRISAKKLQIQADLAAKSRRIRDFIIALIAGLLMAVISYLILTQARAEGISEFFINNALSQGGGSNVVNVILVDFRGFDTLGEITVLSIVALSVYALLRRFRPAPESANIPVQQTSGADYVGTQAAAEQANQGYLLVPGVYLRILFPIISLVAIYFFLRGHNLPGGGFVAGLIFSAGIILQYMLAGTVWVEAQLRIQPHRYIGIGLWLACLTGLGAIAFQHPFLTSHSAEFSLPLLGKLHLPSAFFFDLGVFSTVVGSTMLILIALAHQSLRSRRALELANKEVL